MIDFLDFVQKAPSFSRGAYNEKFLRPVMKDLMTRYHEPQRHYHTFAHIHYGFQQYDRFMGSIESTVGEPTGMRATTYFAWCYHDAVYNPHSEYNEEHSAKVFMQDNRIIGFGMEDADRVVNLILSTTHTGETNIITDIDLSGLGAPLEVYQQNTRRIRTEYSFASDTQWAAGRSAFLKRFIARAKEGKLYHTREFQSYTAQAIDNMTAEVQDNGYFVL